MYKKTALLIVLVFLFSVIPVTAGDKTSSGKQAEFEGTLVCLGCSLKSDDGARAACSTFGHKHALKTAEGKYVNFLENQYSADLMAGKKYHNAEVKVQGVYFANANLLDVETFEVGGKQKGWCGGCKSMDGCSASKGAK